MSSRGTRLPLRAYLRRERPLAIAIGPGESTEETALQEWLCRGEDVPRSGRAALRSTMMLSKVRVAVRSFDAKVRRVYMSSTYKEGGS